MNILKKLSLKSFKLNKKRTIGIVLGIILSTSLICAVAGMFTSFRSTLIENAINEEGYYHLQLKGINNEVLKEKQANRKIKEIKTMYDIGYAKYNEQDKENPYIHIYSTDSIKDLSFQITSGRRPSNNNEIIVSKKVLLDSSLKIGDEITLNVGKRITTDGYELHDSNPYLENEEELINTTTKTYKIVGTFKKPGYNYYAYAVTCKEQTDKITAFVTLKNPKNYKEDIPNVLGQKNWYETELRDLENTGFDYEINNELLRWEVFAFSDSTVLMLRTVISIVIIIIIISSVFCIRNSFAISVTEKTKMYGMLASVGATKKQIKKSVIYEGLILGLIGVPIGVLGGILADFVLIKIVNHIFSGSLFASLDEFVFSVSPLSIVISIILGFTTIYFSCISNARKASKISPIENITNSAKIKLNHKKLGCPKIIKSLFGIGGVLAYKNLKRSKKKYRTTVISITVSVFVFISLNSFLTETFNLRDKYYNSYDYNIELSNVSSLTEENLQKIKDLEDVSEFHTLYEANNHNYLKIYDTSMMNIFDDVITMDEDCTYDENDNRICTGEPYRGLKIHSLDDESYKKYIKKLGLNYETVKDKGILIDEYKFYEGTKERLERSYKYNPKDKITGKYNGKEYTIELASVSSIRPYGIENSYYYGGFLIVNKDYYKDFEFKPMSIMLESKNADETIKMIETIDSYIHSHNYEETKKRDQAMKLVISIFLYGFITVITLIGVTSIFNTITSNMELRAKEFGVLKSIGMTKSEFKHMVNLETVFYSFKSLIFGIILGLLGSLALHKGFSEKSDSSFMIPYIPIILSIIFVFLLVYLIMKFSINKINKQNTIETIREENV